MIADESREVDGPLGKSDRSEDVHFNRMMRNEDGEIGNHGEYGDTVGDDRYYSKESCEHAA